MKTLLNNIEIILSVAGLIVIWSVPELITHQQDSWTPTAVVASSVGVLHGLIFWLIRRRQRKVRNEAIKDIQLMLKDQINSLLTVITISAEQAKYQRPSKEELDNVQATTLRIAKLLASISEESLSRWKDRYPNLFQKA